MFGGFKVGFGDVHNQELTGWGLQAVVSQWQSSSPEPLINWSQRLDPKPLNPEPSNPKPSNPKTVNPKTSNPKTLHPKPLDTKPLNPNAEQNPTSESALAQETLNPKRSSLGKSGCP